MTSRIFLLSPASCSGNRARLLCRDSGFEIATRLRSSGGASLGEVFAFISQLYFRGKLAYGRTFARVSAAVADDEALGLGNGVLVITTSRGLVPSHLRITRDTLQEFASVELHPGNAAYRGPLETTARLVATRLAPEDDVVLLGSIATDKYVSVLLDIFGSRLRFPREFVGRGDMSRGGLMLQSVREARELEYIPILSSDRHGARPPRLPSSLARTRGSRPTA
jgi:hypothetical protein